MTLYVRFKDNPDIVKWFPNVISINKYPNGDLEITTKAGKERAPLYSWTIMHKDVLSVESN